MVTETLQSIHSPRLQAQTTSFSTMTLSLFPNQSLSRIPSIRNLHPSPQNRDLRRVGWPNHNIHREGQQTGIEGAEAVAGAEVDEAEDAEMHHPQKHESCARRKMYNPRKKNPKIPKPRLPLQPPRLPLLLPRQRTPKHQPILLRRPRSPKMRLKTRPKLQSPSAATAP